MSELSPKSLQTEFRDCFGCLPYYEIVYIHPETWTWSFRKLVMREWKCLSLKLS